MRVIAVLAVLAGTFACLPSVALAQSAGDNQYVDPFQEEANQNPGGGDQGGEGGDTTPAPVAPAPTTEPSETGAVDPTETGAGTATTSAQALPATGPAPLPPALLGVGLLLGGAALWRALALRRSA